jgi:hypothetical protein
MSVSREDIWGSGCIDPCFLISALVGSKWSASCSIYPQGKSPQYALNKRLSGPQAGLDDMEKYKFSTLPRLKLQPLCRPACSQSLYQLHYSILYMYGKVYIPVVMLRPEFMNTIVTSTYNNQRNRTWWNTAALIWLITC